MVSSKKMKAKKLPEFAVRINNLRSKLGIETQAEFAERLHVKQPTVSAWERGDKRRAPSAEIYFRLASLAPDRADKIIFLEMAGLDEQAILAAAEGLLEKRAKEAEGLREKGGVILVPRFRETQQGREEAGPPIPLPTEFIPNPGSTICFVVDEKCTKVLDSPRGTLILDESVKDAEELAPLWNQVVLVDYPGGTEEDAANVPRGLYVGRLILREFVRKFGWGDRGTPGAIWHARVSLLTGNPRLESIRVGTFASDPPEGTPWYKNDLLPSQLAQLDRFYKDSRERARVELRLDRGCRILGQVIGRLTGNVGAFRAVTL